jgi:hypothetical protein
MRKLIRFITNWLNGNDVKAGDTGGNILISFMRQFVVAAILIAAVAYFIYTML